MDPDRKRQIRLVVALSVAVILAVALIYTSFNAGTEAREPSDVLAAGPSDETYQLTGEVTQYKRQGSDLEFDITDHAASRLGPTHFQQLDLNATQDLSFFENRGIQLIHMGGFLEYMGRPRELLRSFHRVVGVGGRLIMSMTNFQCYRYRNVARTHHRAWLFKPQVEELREALASQGWCVEREIPFIGTLGWRTRLYRYLAEMRGVNHRWTRKHAWLFITIARAAQR